MRLLIIGNSHVGVLVRAYCSRSSRSNKMISSVRFLVSDGRNLPLSIKVNNTTILFDLRKMSKNFVGRDLLCKDGTLDLLDFDLVVIYGFQLLSSRTGRDWINLVNDAQRGYSSQLWDAFVTSYIESSDHFRLLSMLANSSLSGRLFSLPSPLPNILHPRFSNLSFIEKSPLDHVNVLISECVLKRGFEFLPLPHQLLDERGFATATTFKNDVNVDFWHLSDSGGEVVFDYLLSKLTGSDRVIPPLDQRLQK